MAPGGRVLIVQNCAVEDAGLYRRFLVDRGIDHDVFAAFEGGRFPAPGDYAAFVVCGTPLAAYQVHRHAFLRDEWLFLEAVLEVGKPCLGICFGAQLLARLLRGRAYPHTTREIGGSDVRLTPRGRDDPLFEGFPDEFPVVQWHADTFDIPEGAIHLAESATCSHQAFRRAGAIGLQFHLEVTATDAARWADAYAQELRLEGKTKAGIVAECEVREAAMGPLADRFMANFTALAAAQA